MGLFWWRNPRAYGFLLHGSARSRLIAWNISVLISGSSIAIPGFKQLRAKTSLPGGRKELGNVGQLIKQAGFFFIIVWNEAGARWDLCWWRNPRVCGFLLHGSARSRLIAWNISVLISGSSIAIPGFKQLRAKTSLPGGRKELGNVGQLIKQAGFFFIIVWNEAGARWDSSGGGTRACAAFSCRVVPGAGSLPGTSAF